MPGGLKRRLSSFVQARGIASQRNGTFSAPEPAPSLGYAFGHLLGRGLGQWRPSTFAAQIGVDVAVRTLFKTGELGDEGIELLALVRECPVKWHLWFRLRVLAFPAFELPALPVSQERAHLVRLKEAGEPQVIEFVLGRGLSMHTEGLGLEQHMVEGGLGIEGFEFTQQVIGGGLAAIGGLDQCLRLGPDIGFLGAGGVPARDHVAVPG